MRTIPPMTDLRRTPAEKAEEVAEMMPTSVPDYPYGTSISFDNDTLEKIGLEVSDVEVGDVIEIHGFAKITSVSERDDASEPNGKCCRVEAQITHLATGDSEEEPSGPVTTVARKAKMYKAG